MGIGNEQQLHSRERPEPDDQRDGLPGTWSSAAFLLSGGTILLLTALELFTPRRGGATPDWVSDLLLTVGVLAGVGGLFLHLRRMARRASRLARTGGARRRLR